MTLWGGPGEEGSQLNVTRMLWKKIICRCLVIGNTQVVKHNDLVGAFATKELALVDRLSIQIVSVYKIQHSV